MKRTNSEKDAPLRGQRLRRGDELVVRDDLGDESSLERLCCGGGPSLGAEHALRLLLPHELGKVHAGAALGNDAEAGERDVERRLFTRHDGVAQSRRGDAR